MKKLLFTTLLSVALISVFACTSNKASSDSYDSDAAAEANETESSKTTKSDFSWAKAFGSNKFTLLDETPIYTNTFTNNLDPKDATIAVYDKKKIAGFGSYYMLAYYFVSFETKGRKELKVAYNQYLKDFEEKKLDRKGKNTYKAYGYIDVRLDWGTIQNTTPNYGTTKACIGYRFKNNSPYFTITIFPTDNLREDIPQEDRVASMKLIFYMTKAQGKSLIDYLSDEYLGKYLDLNKAPDEKEPKKEVESDEYTE